MLKNILLVSLGISIYGCATTANYEKKLDGWIGHPEIELVKNWGPPASVYMLSGIKFVTYERSGNVFIPGTSPMFKTTVIGNTAYTNTIGGSSAYNIPTNCKTTFEIRNDMIVSWRWEGNSCRSTSN